MKFHLCGGLDAPDWILANIVTLSSIVRISFQNVPEISLLQWQRVTRVLGLGFRVYGLIYSSIEVLVCVCVICEGSSHPVNG